MESSSKPDPWSRTFNPSPQLRPVQVAGGIYSWVKSSNVPTTNHGCPVWTAEKISTFLLPFWSFKSGWARCVGPRGKSPNKYQFIFSPDFSPTDFLPIFFSREGCTAFAKDFNLLVDFLNFCLSPFQRNKKREVKNSQNYQGIRLTTSRLPIREQSWRKNFCWRSLFVIVMRTMMLVFLVLLVT